MRLLPCVLVLPFVEAAPIFLPRRQLLNTLSITYGSPSSASPIPSKIYLSSSSIALDCPIVPILIAGLYPPFSLAAVSSPFPLNLTEQTTHPIGELTASGEGRWKPDLEVGNRFVVRVVDRKNNVRYSEEKVAVQGDKGHCRSVLTSLLPCCR
jgi:hypothetical protein